MAWSTSGGIGRSCRRVPLASANLKHERQFRAALMRVAGAVPRGAMTSEKALLMAKTVPVVGVVLARRAIIGSQ